MEKGCDLFPWWMEVVKDPGRAVELDGFCPWAKSASSKALARPYLPWVSAEI